jgi:hypothetical protein
VCSFSEKSRGRMTPSEHNIKAHASTRAMNRAIANLVGFGEVSAEEIEREDRAAQTISGPQQKRLFVIAKKAGWSEPQIRSYLFERHGLRTTSAIRVDQYDELCAVFEQPPAAVPPPEETVL